MDRSLDQTYLVILESLVESQGADAAHPGDKDPVATILGSSFHHVDTGVGKHHRGILALAFQPQDPALPWPNSL